MTGDDLPDPGLFPGPTVDDVRHEDIIEELERELAMRRKVYPRWITSGKIDQVTATRRILVLEAALERLR